MNTPSLKASLLERAESNAYFMASAIAVWRQARPETAPHNLLGCNARDLWRVALAPRPRGEQFQVGIQRLVESFALDTNGLISLLRMAEALDSLRDSNPRSAELLMAARQKIDDDAE